MSEMTTLDRVACAISGAPFPSASSLREARAALLAFKDPTSSVLDPAGLVIFNGGHDLDDMGMEAARQVINAAVDAALAEGETK